MKQSTMLGFQFTGKSNNITKSYNFFLRRFYAFCLINCKNLSYTIKQLISHSCHNKVYACIDLREQYFFENSPKTPIAAFAILYDFVDSFVIKGYEDLQDDIDPFINQRMYNDVYHKIFLDVESSLLYEELDEVLSYSMLSNIDGLIFSNPRLLAYAAEKANGRLTLIGNNVSSGKQMKEFADLGVKLAIVTTNKISFLALRLGRKIEKQYNELVEG